LIGVISQRLVRKLCNRCKVERPITPMERKLLGLAADAPQHTLFHPAGCEACDNHGYKGRSSIIEILKITADLDDLISRRASARELRNCALASGFRPLVEDACRRVLDGTTSVDEISRVVDLTERLRD
ncbi:MAG TPA: type II secretion system protein GspE, partial [Pseudomonadales bacterium]